MSSVILVPLDGSQLSERALPFAERLARTGAQLLVLMRAVELFLPAGELPIESEHPMLAEAQTYLQAIATRLTTAGVQVECIVRYGHVAEQILALIRARHPEYVVMATHGRSGFGRWLYGSVADAVMTHSPAPVALVPADATPVPADGRDRLLVPLDGSALSEAVLPFVAELAAQLDAEVVLVRVVPHPAREQLAAARTYLATTAERLTSTTGAPPLRVRAEAAGSPAATIARLAEAEGATVIVMATHGRSGVRRLVLGSVATGTLRRADVPLLLIRAGTEAGVTESRASPG